MSTNFRMSYKFNLFCCQSFHFLNIFPLVCWLESSIRSNFIFENNKKQIILRRVYQIYSLSIKILLENNRWICNSSASKISLTRYLIYLLVSFGEEKWFGYFMIVKDFQHLTVLIEYDFCFILFWKCWLINISWSCAN